MGASLTFPRFQWEAIGFSVADADYCKYIACTACVSNRPIFTLLPLEARCKRLGTANGESPPQKTHQRAGMRPPNSWGISAIFVFVVISFPARRKPISNSCPIAALTIIW